MQTRRLTIVYVTFEGGKTNRGKTKLMCSVDELSERSLHACLNACDSSTQLTQTTMQLRNLRRNLLGGVCQFIERLGNLNKREQTQIQIHMRLLDRALLTNVHNGMHERTFSAKMQY
jgi:hypothetical protein